MRLAIVGSRTFTDWEKFEKTIGAFAESHEKIDEIVSGGARGADRMAERYAIKNKILMTIYGAEWDKYGKIAGYKRNEKIVENCDYLMAFWNGTSRGTKHSIDLSSKHKKNMTIIFFQE